jgi:CheY-like chemotaxis protein
MPPTTVQKILVVDDVPDTRLFISNLLSSQGYNPIMAETRAEGFRKVVEENPAVIIIDMMIPNEGGIQLYRDLKRDPRLHRIPVIMLSTITRKTFFKWHKIRSPGPDLEQAGPDIYLGLPPETEELLLAVKKLSETDSPRRSQTTPSAGSPSITGD